MSLREPRNPTGQEEYLRLPCGGCIGCRMSRAREWSLRCGLELKSHDNACWATLTYDDAHLPPTLQKPHLSAWLKRLRARVEPRRVRFFASGEYGEKSGRPHYHAILFGLSDDPAIRATWPYGFVRVDPLTPAAIAYVAGYTSKKVGWKLERGERVDYSTGEVYEFCPPFVLMSRRPGIGGDARIYRDSWRKSAVYHGREIPVPRFLHNAWRETATPEQIEQLHRERMEIVRDSSKPRLAAAEAMAKAKQTQQAQRRKL